MEKVRDIIIYKNHFLDFYNDQSEKVQSKIDYVLKIVATQQRVPLKFLRAIESEKGLFEVRIEMDSNIYRIFCCFDNGNLVVLFNGFQKKSQKTPKDEIARAVRIMNEYFNDKNK
ncbi:MAG: type II toxin-antitoxin system RelE/ParE family toxin [Bacteroidaceae bacterium]|nr:type II toxin-antitoxin system RelE/ParE family toxin [Bacteroidaceae bacterium]MDY6249505.1 type II toxin-antitoxin system RelE/ParE family toxin [Bacteroidaceae bacterium]